jgi:hypothetical protein
VINTECLHIQNLKTYVIKKNEKGQRKNPLDVSVGGLYNNRGFDLGSL